MTTKTRLIKITFDAAGYRWLAYGVFVKGRWQCHLVELLGAYMLDVPIDRRLARRIRTAVAKALRLPLEGVQSIAPDLILADQY